jgi:hypothetical protein
MDKKSKERVNQIAKSLKELHLSTTMEEALKRAKEIVESAKGMGKPIDKLLREAKDIDKLSEHSRKELLKEARKEHSSAEHNIMEGKKSKASVKKTKDTLGFDIKVHKLEKGDVKEAMQEVDEIDCAIKDADYIIKEAEKIQKKSKKK